MNIVPCNDYAACWDNIAEGFLKNNRQLLTARDRQRQANIAFAAKVIAPGESHELADLPAKICSFLTGYGLQAELEEGIPQRALKDPTLFLETDVIIVLGLTEDIRAFSVELARNPSVASRMIVCIRSGDEGSINCRLLRETYGVETISVCRGELPEGRRCRCGVDVLRHCVDRFVDKAVAGHKAHVIRNTTVLMVHGIRTRALWQGPVAEAIRKAGLLPCPSDYDKFDVFRFLLPGMWLKGNVIKKVEEEIRSAKKNPDVNLAVIAHSFGTFVLGKLLVKKEHSFGRIVLCGSVLPRDFDFGQAEGSFEAIINEVSDHDIWPILAEKLGVGRNYGATGTFGFNRGAVRDRIHWRKKHSDLLNRESCTRYWTPFFCDGDIKAGTHEEARPAGWLRFVDGTPAPVAKLFVLAFLGAAGWGLWLGGVFVIGWCNRLISLLT